MNSIHRQWIGVLLAAVAGASVSSATGDPGGPYHYSYFKDQVPITLDVGRVGVLEPIAATIEQREAMETSLIAAGIAPRDLKDLALPGWHYALMPARGATDQDVRSVVAALARDGAVAFVSPVFKDHRGDPLMITGDLLIGFESAVTVTEAEAILAERVEGAIEEREFAHLPGVYRVRVNSRNGWEVLDLANVLAALPEVRYAEPNMIMTARRALIPNDTLFSTLWGLHNTGQSGGTADQDMDGPEAWDITTGDAGVKVVILDDGVEQDHPDLNQVPGLDAIGLGTGGGPFNRCDNHGTAVAGCVSAIINNGLGVVGIAPDCKVASAKYTAADDPPPPAPCPGSGVFFVDGLVDSLDWAESIGARVTNNSNGFSPSSTVTDKYNLTHANGMIHFAASGNDGSSTIGYPASLSSVNAVGAVNRNGVKPSFGTFGPGLAFAAPAESIGSTDRTGSDGYSSGDYTFVDGTSFASPYAAGVAALLLAWDDTLTAADVVTSIQDGAVDRGDPGYDEVYGWGFVNALGALEELFAGACCLPDGTCEVFKEDACGLALGAYQGNRTECPPDPPCVPVDTAMSCQLSNTGVFPDTDVKLELFVEEVADVKTYQADVEHALTSGVGSLTVSCPDGVVVDVARPDFVFSDLPPGSFAIPGINCEALELAATIFGEGSATVGSARKYIGDVTFHVSSDATPDSTFQISLNTSPTKSFLLDVGSQPIPTRFVCSPTLTVFDPSGIRPPGAEPGGTSCVTANNCTGAYQGADCVEGICYGPKNRYVSIDPTVNFGPVAYQVEIDEAADYPAAVGRTWWIGEPVCYDYPNGSPDPNPNPSSCTGPNYFGWVSRLSSTIVERTWDESPLHVTGCGVVPAVRYRIRATNDGGSTFSPDMTIGTAADPDGEAQSWGDITGGPVPGQPPLWLPPEGATNFGDVGNAIRTFENKTEGTAAPPLVWVDVEVNQVVNLADIQFIITAFEGTAYASLADLQNIGVDPVDCP